LRNYGVKLPEKYKNFDVSSDRRPFVSKLVWLLTSDEGPWFETSKFTLCFSVRLINPLIPQLYWQCSSLSILVYDNIYVLFIKSTVYNKKNAIGYWNSNKQIVIGVFYWIGYRQRNECMHSLILIIVSKVAACILNWTFSHDNYLHINFFSKRI
jgi:hypothetical protein